MLGTRGSGKVTTMKARANKTKGIRCLEHTLLGQSTRRHMLDLYIYATSANFTIMGRALITKCSKKVGHIIQNRKTPATAKDQRTRTCYECGSLRHYKKPTTAEQEAKHWQSLHCKAWGEETLGESKPLCSKCYYYHDGPCAPKCHKCNRVGHLARDCKSSTNANTTNIQKGTGASQKATCFECGNQGQYRRDCPERKNQIHENQIKSTKARGVVHAFGGGETEQDLNNIEDEIKA
nr:hypothetical protein [Tanacetum cinerariifolium]